jgi:hypothetical protein
VVAGSSPLICLNPQDCLAPNHQIGVSLRCDACWQRDDLVLVLRFTWLKGSCCLHNSVDGGPQTWAFSVAQTAVCLAATVVMPGLFSSSFFLFFLLFSFPSFPSPTVSDISTVLFRISQPAPIVHWLRERVQWTSRLRRLAPVPLQRSRE